MLRAWRESAFIKCMAVLGSIGLLWLTLCCSFAVVIGIEERFYVRHDGYLEQLLNDHADIETIQDYYRLSLRSNEADSAFVQSQLETFQKQFDSKKTNLRFQITNLKGELLLTNDPLAQKKQNLLVSESHDIRVPLQTERYEVKHHFNSILDDTDISSLLENPDEYLHWYYAENSLTQAYQKGFEAVISDSDGNFVRQHMDLSPYFEMKSTDADSIFAEDAELEKILQNTMENGVDIVIVGEHIKTESLLLRTYLPQNLSADDAIRSNINFFRIFYRLREWLIVAAFVLLTFATVAAIIMCSAAGHVKGQEGITVSRIHRFPYELYLLLFDIVITACLIILDFLFSGLFTSYRTIALISAGLLACCSAVCILLLYTTAIRIKSGSFWQSWFLIRTCTKIFHAVRGHIFYSLAITVHCILLFVSNVFFLMQTDVPLLDYLILIADLATLAFFIYVIYGFFTLKKRVSRMEHGDYAPIPLKVPLHADFKDFSESLDNMTGGIENMIEKQLRAERMRTELITNVSHDLKTPLTSIVNYVDLLGREPMQTEHAAEYLEVLRRQSARLKKLTEDLVDASKASSGCLNVDLQPTNLNVLIPQIACEFEDKLAERKLDLVTDLPQQPVQILADGRHIFRVFSNLIGNACKYSMPASRIYLTVSAAETANLAVITLKNISEFALNVSPDELTERFVRGDASRHTEGSGLGLSIAKDLARMQGGTLELRIDGDLFKAILTFPIYQPQS